jgi:alkylated DNA repair dioxygenase AlkB
MLNIPGLEQEDTLTPPYEPHFLTEGEAQDLFTELLKLHGWTKRTGTRSLITFYDGDAMVSNYSGTKEPVRPWTEAPGLLTEVREKLKQKYGAPFPNICRIQRYEDEDAAIAPHRDQKLEGSWEYPIATISLGQERCFIVYNCTCTKEGPCPCCKKENQIFNQDLAAGSLLEMPVGFQAEHKHCIAKTTNEVGTRISLTFRYLSIEEKKMPVKTANYKLHTDAYKPPQKTIGGYSGYEVTSALQKCIRRGLEKDALFWATELWASCNKEGREYIWHRLRVIASEDVGLANNNACVQVSALYANFTRRPNEKLFLWHAVLLLARAPKSRIVDHAGIVITRGDRGGKTIPDFALDNHAGGEMNWTESFKLENRTLEDEYEAEALKLCEGKI